MILFFKVFFTEFIAEMGDKTQLMLIALTSKYKLRDIILGTGVAILVLNGMAVLAGGLVSEFIPDWLIKTIAALAFLYFAASTIAGDDEEEEEGGKTKIKFAPLAVFCTFFVAELGDKTQLTAITFGANEGMRAALVVWIGCSLGLFAADMLGMLIGYLLKSNLVFGARRKAYGFDDGRWHSHFDGALHSDCSEAPSPETNTLRSGADALNLLGKIY
mgnify:CR=1 FL=1